MNFLQKIGDILDAADEEGEDSPPIPISKRGSSARSSDGSLLGNLGNLNSLREQAVSAYQKVQEDFHGVDPQVKEIGTVSNHDSDPPSTPVKTRLASVAKQPAALPDLTVSTEPSQRDHSTTENLGVSPNTKTERAIDDPPVITPQASAAPVSPAVTSVEKEVGGEDAQASSEVVKPTQNDNAEAAVWKKRANEFEGQVRRLDKY